MKLDTFPWSTWLSLTTQLNTTSLVTELVKYIKVFQNPTCSDVSAPNTHYSKTNSPYVSFFLCAVIRWPLPCVMSDWVSVCAGYILCLFWLPHCRQPLLWSPHHHPAAHITSACKQDVSTRATVNYFKLWVSFWHRCNLCFISSQSEIGGWR